MKTLTAFLAVLGWMAGLSCWGQAGGGLPLPDAASIRGALQRANDYFLAHDNLQTNGWARGVYHTGNMRAYELLGTDRYLESSLNWATSNAWQAGFKGATNADGEVCGQTYIDLYRMEPHPVRIAAVKAGIDSRVASAAATQDWWWVDAFFMAGPVFARFGNLYSTNTYFDKMWLMYDDMRTRRALFDPAYGLWYRDETAQTAVTKNGKKQFWGRGNGWVMAALTRVLEEMPPSQGHRADYIAMLQTMAAALKPWQGADGMWRSSLIDPAEYPNPETSCTALITCALASGLRNGYLNAADYQSVVARAWNGMVTNALHTNGLVGFVQPQGKFPDSATYDSTDDFGVGVFLLAGGEMLRLAGGGSAPPVLTSQPLSQSVAITSNAQFSATAAGPAPLRYLWLKDGITLPGATNTTLLITNTQIGNAGSYSVIITNSFGSVTSAPASLSVLTLAGALDTPHWTWTSGGSAPWTPEGSVTHDGRGALQSGKISNSQTSWLETAMSGPVTLTFWWKVSSETNTDLLRFLVDGSEQIRISGEVDWHSQTFNLPAGNHALRWAYSKNGSTAKGQDRGWVDQVGIACTYALSQTSQMHGFTTEAGLVSVAANNTLCTWSILNSNDWVMITSTTNGTGSADIRYVVAANPTAIPRTGMVMIADQSFTITQVGAPCMFEISPASRVHGAARETGLVSVITIDGCAWMVSNSNDWITITSSTNGTGPGGVSYTVTTNPTSTGRTGGVTIAGQTFTITNLGNVSLSCAPDKTVECGGEWNFDNPAVASGCPDTNIMVQTVSTTTNAIGFCGRTFSATRLWSAVDACSNSASCHQTVTVVDTTPPVLVCAENKTVELGAWWDFHPPTATDRCDSAPASIRVVSTVTNASGFCGNTFEALRTWEAMDSCGNRISCGQKVSVVDTTPPELVCTLTKGVICGTAWLFDEPAVFDLADGTNVTIAIVDTVTNGNCNQTLMATRTWLATDRCGNSSMCSQTVTNSQLVIAGTVSAPTNYPSSSPSEKRLAAVSVDLTGDDSQTTQTDSGGRYAFTVNAGGTYTVTPNLPAQGGAADGVTTFDISLIRRHILSLSSLDSPYWLLAADVNGSASVTTLDISRIRQLILGLTDTFTRGLWRVTPSDYGFPDPKNPWDVPASRSYTNLLETASGQDFVAIKLGDVNYSWTPTTDALGNSLRKASKAAPIAQVAAPEVVFHVSRHTNQPGESVTAQVSVTGFHQVTSVQFTLVWDPGVLRYVRTADYELGGLSAGNFGTPLANSGELTFSWDDPATLGVTVPDSNPIFTVDFVIIGKAGDVSPLELNDAVTGREIGVNFGRAILRAENGQVTVGSSMLGLGRPMLRHPGYDQGAFSVSLSTVGGHRYILEFSDALPATNWTALPTITGDGTVKVLTAPAPPSGQRFYRVEVQ